MKLIHTELYFIRWSCFTIAPEWSFPQLRSLNRNQALSLMDHRYLILSLVLIDVSIYHVRGRRFPKQYVLPVLVLRSESSIKFNGSPLSHNVFGLIDVSTCDVRGREFPKQYVLPV